MKSQTISTAVLLSIIVALFVFGSPMDGLFEKEVEVKTRDTISAYAWVMSHSHDAEDDEVLKGILIKDSFFTQKIYETESGNFDTIRIHVPNSYINCLRFISDE